jgi:hypothetical protein
VSGFRIWHGQSRSQWIHASLLQWQSSPQPRPWARPAILGAFAIAATLPDDEVQWLFREISCELPSLNVPTAENY